MRPFMVIEVHGGFHGLPNLWDTAEVHAFKELVLDGIVHPFGNGILLWIPAFGHAYANLSVSQTARIRITGVLGATIRMMDMPFIIFCLNILSLQ